MSDFLEDDVDIAALVRDEIGKLGGGKPVINLEELADEVGLPLSTLETMRRQGLGPRAFKIGRRIFVRRQAVDDWLARLETEFVAQAKWLGGSA